MNSANFGGRPRNGMVDFSYIVDVDKSGAVDQRLRARIVEAAEPLPHLFPEPLRISARCYGPEGLTVIKQQPTMANGAEAVRLFQHRVEYRCEVAGRGIDDLQYLGGRGLPLQGF